MMRKMSKHIDISLPKYKWGKCHCHDCDEDDIMWEKSKVYIPLPDNVRPKYSCNPLDHCDICESSLRILENEETRNFMGMNEVEFETFMNQLLEDSSSGLEND